ncbi:A/G-specific adenine glycosylase [Sinimarinibacterium thermocellulolyticum]|uniref:A/G-specific adenine glycosylase n=1 Tax=Sinimarinibacterium thermocellulolyticum TaxID=3170016 RepID=UPI003339D3CD
MPRDFAARLLAWFDLHGRRDLPWQKPREPYRVWLSEIMLQQTQVTTVIPYFERFVARFADVNALASASIDEVLALWSGLGYYARARNLHRCARQIVAEHGGEFPRSVDALAALPGIGRSTAGAIAAQAWGTRAAILDGNVRRVLARHRAVDGWPGTPAVHKRLWAIAEALLPETRLADYTQALMDLGATVCRARRPACARCPLAGDCTARQRNDVTRYPAARPRKPRPLRRARLVLAQNPHGELLLERRAPLGIWGGLWCPPLLDDAALGGDGTQALLDRAQRIETLGLVRHGFTHFDLELQPLRVELPMPCELAEPERRRWVSLDELATLGLPAPVRKLLTRLFTTAST